MFLDFLLVKIEMNYIKNIIQNKRCCRDVELGRVGNKGGVF